MSNPVAWAVNHAHGTTFWDTEAKARKVSDEWLASGIWVWTEVVPLYTQPQPTLTDAELEAISMGETRLKESEPDEAAAASTLRGLLERHRATPTT